MCVWVHMCRRMCGCQRTASRSCRSPQGPGERTLDIVPGGKCIFGSSLTFTGLVGVGFSSFGGPA